MSRKRYPVCIFCRKNDSEPSLEDVIPKWIARQFPGHKKSQFVLESGRFDAPPERRFGTVGHFGLTTTGPCKRCNNEWMSTIETSAKPILLRLMRGENHKVTSSEGLVIARWTFKTALLYEYMKYRGRPKYFTQADRTAFFKSRLMPSNTFIFAARYAGASATKSIGGPVLLGRPHPSPGRPDGYCSTTVVQQFAFQVLSFRPKDGAPFNWAPRSGPWNHQVERRVWPIRGNWAWPPELALDDGGLNAFATRWADEIY